MNNDDSVEKAAWHSTLPMKRMAAGCVFENIQGQFLIVKPTYKEFWELPGGVVEQDESPSDTCRREVAEELGINVDPGALLCVDYCSSKPGYTESLQFLFYAGVLSEAIALTITLDSTELSDWKWADLDEATALLGHRVARRLRSSVPHIGAGATFLMNQEPPA